MYEQLRDLLCSEISMLDIMKRCDLIKEQLQRPVDVFVEECIPKYKLFVCECGNTNEEYTHTDELQGLLVCMQCGYVLQTSLLYKEPPIVALLSVKQTNCTHHKLNIPVNGERVTNTAV